MTLLQGKRTRMICLCAVFTATAMMLSYLEALLPLTPVIPLPGFKLGLANTVTVLVFALISPRAAAAVSALRILLMGLLFGSAVSLFFSAAGGLLSFAALLLASRLLRRCSYLGISVLCAAAHNLGQLLAAACLFGREIFLSYLPVLLLAALLSGGLTGILLNLSVPRLQRSLQP